MVKKESQKGLTIVEMTVTIAIILILSAVVFANYRSSEKQLALQRAVNKLAQDIRRAEGMAGIEWTMAGCSVTPNYKYGYGVFFNTAYTYKIFADCNGNHDYDPATDKTVEDILLENNIEKIIGTNIVFDPPDPSVFSATSFGLRIKDPVGPIKTVNINEIGAIDIY